MVIAVSDGVPGTRETTKIEIITTAAVAARVAEGRFTTLPFVRKLAVPECQAPHPILLLP